MHFMKSLFAQLAGFAAVGTLALAPVAFAETSTATGAVAIPSPVTVNVNAGGRVLVRGAVVTGISGNAISAMTSWGSESLSWSIGVASSTELLGKSGRVALSDMKSGDRINFSGSLDKTASMLSVNAQVVRDASLTGSVSAKGGEKSHLIEGKLEAVSGDTLTLMRGNQTITVNLGANAEVKQKNFKVTDLGSLKIGDHIRVLGTGTTSVDASIVRDSSH
jgi:hypothetical protein